MRRSVFSALFLACLVGPSFAGEPARPETVTPVGAPHTCMGFYPEAEREAHVGGVVSLAFRITPAGAVTNVAVTKSSGNTDLDDAAKICVRTWRYAPVLKDGTAVEASWSAEVEWRGESAVVPPTPPTPMPVLLERPAVCQSYPWWAKKDHVEGNAKLTYSIASDGSTSAVVMTKSSGNADLDGAAIACVKALKFRPLSGSGSPQTLWAEVTWSNLERGPWSLQWNFNGTISQVGEATEALTAGVVRCLRGASGRADLSGSMTGVTAIWVSYDRGEISAVSVLHPSGNDALDQFAVGCFKSQPADPERARAMRHARTSKFAIVWPLYAH